MKAYPCFPWPDLKRIIRCFSLTGLFSFSQMTSAAEVAAMSADPGPTPGDLFQGAVIDAAPSSPVQPGFDLRDAFGGTSSTAEVGRVVMADGQGSAVQNIFFHTAAPVTLSGIKLYLGDDPFGRAASHVELAITDSSFTANTVLASADIATPYATSVGANNISHILVTASFAPVTGQYFVLRLTPNTPNNGVRVIELDGVSPTGVLAASHADFTTAGFASAATAQTPVNGFTYGYYDAADSTAAAFTTGTSGSNLMQVGLDGPRPIWWADVGGTNSPSVTIFMQHPGSNSKPAVRRYVVGAGGEPAYTGTVRVVGRYFDLNDGSTNVFVAVDPDGDAGGAARNLSSPSALPSTPLNGPAPVSFDFTTSVAPGTTIDFGVLSNGVYYSDATGMVAWIVTEEVAVPTHLVANNYSSVQFTNNNGAEERRGTAFSLVTDGLVSGTDLGSFDTSPGSPYTHAGLLYLENSGSGKVTKFNSVRIDVTTGADFAELPHLFLLRHNSDPGSLNPSQDERYVRLPVTAVRTAANSEGQPYYTFDLTSLPESQRTGYGFAVFGRGSYSGGAIAVSEIAADAERISDAGHAPAWPTWIDYNGHRYALTFTRGTWDQCEAEAVSYGGHLVSINSAEENDWVFDTFGREADTFIGLRQNPLQSNVEPNGGWTWMDGTVLSDINGNNMPGVYENWNDAAYGGSEPNHYSGAGEDYAMFVPTAFSGRSQWGDVRNNGHPGNLTHRGIIELPNINTAPGVKHHQLSVSGQANIFGAGQANPTPCVNPGSGGVAAPFVPVFGGQKVVLTAASGSINTASDIAGPDGSRHPTKQCDISGVGGVSGYLNRNNTAHLVGVFVADTPLLRTPGRIDFSTDAIGENFEVIGPKLGQVFFIGDGLTPGGKTQEFLAPEGATKLYLGVPDAYNGNNTYVYTGPPNAYADNSGYYNIRLAVQPNATARFNTPGFPGTGGAFSLVGGEAPFDPITVGAGSLPPGFTINDKTLLGRASEEGQYTFTLQSQDALDAVASKTYTVDIPAASKNLVAWWKGDTDATDSAGGNDGTFTGANATAAPGGVVGSGSLLFNGGDIVTVPNTPEINLTGDFTMEMWLRRDVASGIAETVISKRENDDSAASYVFYLQADGRLAFASHSPGNGWDYINSSFIIPADQLWRHVAVTCAGTTLRMYVDGKVVHTAQQPARPVTSAPLTIGGMILNGYGLGDHDFTGRIDELAFYSRALKSAEIAAIVDAENLGKVIRVNPGIVDEDFHFRGGQLTIEGGTGPYSVTLVDGDLPEGIELSSTGFITGTAANGVYSFTLQVTDANNRSSERTFSGDLQLPLAAPAGLAAWWPGQNTVAEIIGGDHAAAPDNNPQYTTGKVGRAFSFNGTSQSLQTAATDVMKHLPLTIEAWIKPEARTSGNLVSYLPTNVIANDRVNFGGHGFGAHLYPDGSMLRVGIEGETEDFRTVPGVTFTNNTWVHVVVVYTEGNVKTYLDGVEVDDYSFTQGELNGGDIIRIGRHNDDTGYGSMRFFQGAIDELSLYHAALSAEQAAALFQAGSLGKARSDAGMEFVMSEVQDTGSAWSYGSIPGGSIDTSLFALSETSGTASDGIIYWAPSAGGVTALNPTGTTISAWGAGGAWIRTLPQQIRQHPGSSRPNVIRWTAPAAGRYAVTGSFTGLDEAGVNTSGYVYQGSLPMNQLNGQAATATLASEYMGNGHSLTGVIDAEAGHTVDFIVSGDASYDSTGTFASIVYLGPSLAPPATLAIDTDLPAKIGRMWFFETEFNGDAFVDPELRIQYAEANTPNDWYDLDVQDGTNRMTPPTGDDVWTMPAFLDLPVGNYRFRVVAYAAGYADKAGPAFGMEALGEPGTDPIPLSAPGQPPPPPPPQPMPAASKMTYSINGKSNATTAKQGQVAKFVITQPLPAGTPTPEIKVEWSTTPADDNSWDSLDNQTIVYNKTAKTWTVTATHLPAANGVYFRTLTKGRTRLATPGPMVSNALKLAGPVNISPGALWRWVAVSYKSSSDGSGDTANTGDTITYTLAFKNEGAAPATNVEAVIQMPAAGVEFVSATDGILPTGSTNPKKLVWKIPSLAPNVEVEKELTVQIKATAGTKVTLPRSGVTVKCSEIPALKQADLTGRASRKLIETMVFSSLRLSIKASEVEDDDEPVASIAKMGQIIYYTLEAENKSASAITNASASLRIPDGMTMEYVRLRDGANDFVYTKLSTPSPTSNPSVTPHVYKGQQLITWFLNEIPPNTTRTMKFALRVMFDLPSTRIENGVYVTNSIVIDDYNLTAKAGTKTINAFASKGAPITALLTDEWYTERAPNLVLTKTALADGQAFGSHSPVTEYLPNGQRNPLLLGTSMPGIGGVAAPHKGTRITYTLNWANKYYPQPQNPADTRPPAEARNAVIHEEIPANTTFIGWLRRDDAPLPSSHDITFRTKDRYEIPSGGEPFNDTNGNNRRDFTDKNGNGVWDAGEPFTETWVASLHDTNGNKRYDAFTDTRYIDYRLKNLVAGASGKLTYDVIATGEEGHPIVSRANGAMIPDAVGGMYYSGYSIWCENRYQAGTATPEKLVSMISRPVEIVPPVITGETQADLQPGLGQRFKLEIGYGVKGVASSGLQDFLLTVTVPKPLIVVPSAATPAPRTGMVNSALPIGTNFRALRGYHADQTAPSFRRGESAPTITSNATDTTIVFKLGGLIGGQSGAVGLELQLPADLPKSLFDAEGYLKLKSYDIRAEMSHKKVGSIELRPASGMVVIEPALVAAAPSPSAAAPRSTPLIGGLLKSTTRLFLGRVYPLSVRPEDSFNMIVFFGNATNTLVQGGEVTMAIPPGLTLSYYSPVVYYYTGATPAQDNLYARYEFIKPANGVLKIQTLDMAPHTMAAALISFDVAKGISGNTIEDGSLSVTSQNAGTRTAVRMCIGIQRDNFFSNLFNAVLSPIFNGLSEAVARILRPANEHLINANSRYLSIVGADIVQLTNGSIVVPLQGGRVAAIGSVNYVHALDGNTLSTDGSYRVTMAHRSVSDFRISGINTKFRTGEVWNPHDILAGIGKGGVADLVAAGGGNMVAAGGLNLIGNDGSTLINNNTGAALAQVAFRAPTMVAAGGGNMVAAGAGNMVAAGGGNLIGNDGSTLIGNDGSTLIGLDGSTLIGLDGGTFKMATTNLVAAGAGNMVAAGAGNMVAAGAGNIVAAGGLNFSATAASSLISSSASSMLAGRLAGAGLMENIARSQFINPASSAGGILSHNGGQILSHNGGLIKAP